MSHRVHYLKRRVGDAARYIDINQLTLSQQFDFSTIQAGS